MGDVGEFFEDVGEGLEDFGNSLLGIDEPTRISVPGPSPEERQLASEQVALLRQQRDILSRQLREQQLLAPFLFRSLNLEPIIEGGEIVGFRELPDPLAASRARLSELTSARERILGAIQERDRLLEQIQTETTGPLMALDPSNPLHQRLLELDPSFRGIDPSGAVMVGTTIRGSLEDQLANIEGEIFQLQSDPRLRLATLEESFFGRALRQLESEEELAPQRAEIARLLGERSLAALRGELPLTPGLLRDLEEEEERLRERLRRQLGPGFETSTPGIEALGEFMRRREEILEGARRGELTLAEQLGLSRQAAGVPDIGGVLSARQLSDALAGNRLSRLGFASGFPFRGAPQFSQIAQGFQMPLSQLFGQRQLQTRANIAAAQARAQTLGSLFGGLGTGLGTLGGMWAFKGLFPPKG